MPGILGLAAFFSAVQDVILKTMNPQPGEVTADLGCGLGFDALRLARLSEPRGCMGVDLSATLLASARSIAQDGTAVFVRADIQKLPFLDRSLHSCKVDRTLQHIESPSAVLNEVFRILRPGGAVVCAEPDWSTFKIAHCNRSMVRQIAELWAASFRNLRIGRKLGRQLCRAGFVDVKTQPALLMAPSFEPSDKVFDIVQSATRLAQATGSEAPLDWIANATEVDHTCPVWSSVTLYVNFARRP